MKMQNKISLRYFFIAILLGCASQGFPPGGPEDKTPPFVVATVPEANSLHVPRDIEVKIDFSEKLDARSVRKSVFISPSPGKDLEIQVKGKSIKIRFSDLLLEDITYTITLGSGIKDLRGNSMTHSYTLAFSTGDHLDRFEIRGKVYYENPEDVTVWAYFLDGEKEVNPIVQQPQYITQCGKDGSFQFYNLAPRTYRLFAVLDRNMNHTFQVNQEMIGLTFKDVSFNAKDSSQIGENCFFRLMRMDTSRTRILQVSQPDRRHLILRFSRMVYSTDPKHSIFIADFAKKPLQTLDVVPDTASPDRWFVTTAPRDSMEYEISCLNLRDNLGQIISDTVRFIFKSTANPDTVRPQLAAMLPEDSARTVLTQQPIRLRFTEALDTTSFTANLEQEGDSSKAPAFRVTWNGLTQVSIWPQSVWPEKRWLRLILFPTRIKDLAGNPLLLPDSSIAWRTISLDTLSEISGRIYDEDSTGAGKIVLNLFSIELQKKIRSLVLPDTGIYRFESIFPGKYLIDGFRDSDGNGSYSFGRLVPFQPAERFFVGQDTILVRSRWPNEGNNYILPK